MPLSDVFVIMPFGEQTVTLDGESVTYDTAHFDDLYELIKEATQDFDPTVSVERMERKHGNLVAAIIKRIHEADLVIAVLSGRNPNVFYELGMRHALKRGTVMLVSDRNEYPFDLKGYYSEQYSIDTGRGRRHLKDFLIERLGEYAVEKLDDSPVLDVLEIAEREQWRALSMWEARRAAMVFRGLITVVGMLVEWSNAWITKLNNWKTEAEISYEPIALVPFGALQTFANTFPIVGLPGNSYIDAVNLANMYGMVSGRLAQLEIDIQDSEVEGRPDIAEFGAQNLFPFACLAVLFADDLCTALEYVIKERKAHAIPWPDSMDDVQRISDGLALIEKQKQLGARINEVAAIYVAFEVDFSGAPPGQ